VVPKLNLFKKEPAALYTTEDMRSEFSVPHLQQLDAQAGTMSSVDNCTLGFTKEDSTFVLRSVQPGELRATAFIMTSVRVKG